MYYAWHGLHQGDQLLVEHCRLEKKNGLDTDEKGFDQCYFCLVEI